MIQRKEIAFQKVKKKTFLRPYLLVAQNSGPPLDWREPGRGEAGRALDPRPLRGPHDPHLHRAQPPHRGRQERIWKELCSRDFYGFE